MKEKYDYTITDGPVDRCDCPGLYAIVGAGVLMVLILALITMLFIVAAVEGADSTNEKQVLTENTDK